MPQFYVTSDTHFCHGRILVYCNRLQFCNSAEKEAILNLKSIKDKDALRRAEKSIRISRETIERMNQGMIDNINAKVQEDDTLFHLGDFCFGTESDWHHMRNKIRCKNFYLLTGNHDENVPRNLFTRVYPHYQAVEVKWNGTTLVLNHYKLATWDKQYHGVIHLFGHTHGKLPDDPHALSMDVGVDCNNYHPYSLDDVKAFMAKKTILTE